MASAWLSGYPALLSPQEGSGGFNFQCLPCCFIHCSSQFGSVLFYKRGFLTLTLYKRQQTNKPNWGGTHILWGFCKINAVYSPMSLFDKNTHHLLINVIPSTPGIQPQKNLYAMLGLGFGFDTGNKKTQFTVINMAHSEQNQFQTLNELHSSVLSTFTNPPPLLHECLGPYSKPDNL